MDPKFELKEVLKNSSLAENDKSIWQEFINRAPANQLVPIIEAIRALPDSLAFLNENLKEKIKAISQGDNDALNKIFKGEEKYLSGLGE